MNKNDDLKKLYLTLERLNDFFHQPDNFVNVKDVQKFAQDIYPDLHSMYYDVVWDMLPDDLKKEFSER